MYALIYDFYHLKLFNSCLRATFKIECFIYQPPPKNHQVKELYTKWNCIICNLKYLEVNIVFDQVHYIIKSAIKCRSNEGIS